MSSRTAVCGQPPVSTARIRSAASASWRTRNSASSFVKMSLVTTARLWSSRSSAAQRQQQRGLAAADRAADADRERARASSRARAARARSWNDGRGRVVVSVVRECGMSVWCIVSMRMSARPAAPLDARHSGLNSREYKPVVRRLQQIEQRRRLRRGRRSASCAASPIARRARAIGAHADAACRCAS